MGSVVKRGINLSIYPLTLGSLSSVSTKFLKRRPTYRKLAKDPDRWAEMKDVLPLLSHKKYYKVLRYGYARGNEAVR